MHNNFQRKYKKLQDQIGYWFKDESILEHALIHASLRQFYQRDNEKMEFLGDRVLGLVIAENLFYHKDLVVGDMARRLAYFVSRRACREITNRLDLFHYARLASGITDDPQRHLAISANLCEALIAAIYLDGGLEAARAFIETFWKEALSGDVDKSPKNILQETAQAQGGNVPIYEVISCSGPDHAPTFIVEVSAEPLGRARGEGSSRQIAEKAAASCLLVSMKQE